MRRISGGIIILSAVLLGNPGVVVIQMLHN